MHPLEGQRVVVMGLGRFGGGVGAARYAVKHGADVLVTDQLNEKQLARSLSELRGLPIDYRLGEHNVSDLTRADLVIVNPAVDRRNNPLLRAAEAAAVPLTSEIELLIERLPQRGRTIGVTGTAGKSTTVAMIGHAMAACLGASRVHVGGNLGGSLLDVVDDLGDEDWVVLELSSFMLETLGNWSPHIAVVTNLSDNHLDRHETPDAYRAAKQRLLGHQQTGDFTILGETVADWAEHTPAKVTVVKQPLEANLLTPGEHNRLNAAMALAAARCAGVPPLESIRALEQFPGLPHRMQFLCEHNGVTFYNDSKSTTPASAMLAIDAFKPGTLHLILGGSDKKADLSALARHAVRHGAAIYTIGQTGPAIAEAATECEESNCRVHRCETLEKATEKAIAAATAGQTVLLSPGCASWDQFENFEQRGRTFAELVIRFTDNE